MRHKISHHSDGRDHECEECGKKFKLAESLVRHKVVHKTEKDYKCEVNSVQKEIYDSTYFRCDIRRSNATKNCFQG